MFRAVEKENPGAVRLRGVLSHWPVVGTVSRKIRRDEALLSWPDFSPPGLQVMDLRFAASALITEDQGHLLKREAQLSPGL